MFIREAYAKRVKKEQQQGNQGRLLAKNTASMTIGSVKNNKINYDREQQFFCKEDIPQRARTIKQEVKDFVDPDFLGLRKKVWNTSVSVPKNIEDDQSHERKLTKIKLGMFDHPISKFSETKIYQGTQIRDDYSGWQVSTEVTKKQMEDNFDKMTTNAKLHSKAMEIEFLSTYLDPVQRSKNLIQTQHGKRIEEQDLRTTLKSSYQYENPNASEQKTNAAVFRLAYQTGLAVLKNQTNTETVQPSKPFKANLTQSMRQKVKVKHHHDGVWQLFIFKKKDDSEQYYAWSCCMNEDSDSPGCITTRIDGNRWNLASFNS